MNPKPAEILDTILGYLGFVATVQEESVDGTTVLQVLTSEPERLIGRREQVMDDLQLIVNRILAAQMPPGPWVVVDIAHHRAMRDDALAEQARQLGNVVRSTGRPMHTAPLNAYDRRIVHNVFKDDPEISTSSPKTEEKLKRVTLRKRPLDKPAS
jgi:spoIIIJ-associated protein